MKTLVFIICILGSVSLIGQEDDPNREVKEMGLTDEYIEILCGAANGTVSAFHDWGLPAVFDLIYSIEEKPWPEWETKAAALVWLGEIWNKKYSKCYCQDSILIGGSLDMISVLYEKDNWVWKLYADVNNTGALINRIRYLSYDIKEKGTLLDYIYYIRDEDPIHQVETDSSFADHLEKRKEKVRKYGCKRMSEMTPEEIEQNSK